MIDDIFLIEKYAYRKSPVHTLDARVKIVVAFAAIIAIVAVPYSTVVYSVGAVFFLFCAVLWGLSGLSPVIYAKRLLVILPFGMFLIVFQIFFKNRYYETFTTLATLPFGIEIYAESVEFASILLIKFLVSVSFIILLSSTTKTQDFARRCGAAGPTGRVHPRAGDDAPLPVRLWLHDPEDAPVAGDPLLRSLRPFTPLPLPPRKAGICCRNPVHQVL
jgi:cobalt/nickel transport system permease protein